MHVHAECSGMLNSDRIGDKLGRRQRYRTMLLTRAPAAQARLHRHLSTASPSRVCENESDGSRAH
jgi:hypothetical protein